jgi:hypothetical protein
MAPRAIAVFRACALIVALSPFLFASARGVASREGSGKDPALDSQIAALVEAASPAQGFGPAPLSPALVSMRDAGLMRFDASGRLMAYVYPSGSLAAAGDAVIARGGKVERTSDELGAVLAALPLVGVQDVAHDDAVRYVSLPRYPVLNAGGRVTEGDAILGVDDMRAAYGVDGEGIKVGVISDGIWRYEKSQQSGDLPAEINYTTCNAVPELDPAGPLAGGEGTALLEIVHDLAPGAELWFGSFGFSSSAHGTEIEFMEAVTCLAQHVDVVVDDISWFGIGPYDGTSTLSLNTSNQLNSPSNPIRLYATSAGNWARRHYNEPYQPCNGADVQTFQGTALTIDSHGAGPQCSAPLTLGGYSSLLVFLQWDDEFGASCNDYDLVLREHGTANVLASSMGPQTCDQDPVEQVVWSNVSLSSVELDLVVENVGGLAAPRQLDLFIIGADDAVGLPYYTLSGSVPSQGDAGGGVISVGAIGAYDDPPDDIEPYSSIGPTADGRMKPDITAIDCVNVTGNGFHNPPFCGTSASAPHIAGIAALLLDCNPGLLAASGGSAFEDRAELSDAILKTAADRGELGPDNVYGFGLVDPLLAAEAVCVDSTDQLGDVNCDSGVDAVDALFILRAVAQIEPEAHCINLGDVDCDLALDAVDSLGVLRFVAGIPLPPPPGCRPIGS